MSCPVQLGYDLLACIYAESISSSFESIHSCQ